MIKDMTRKSSAYIGWTQSRLQKLCENEKKIPKPIDIFHVLGYNDTMSKQWAIAKW